MNTNGFLPVNEKEIRERGWDRADFVYVTGDAYVDNSSFGAAIITRVLEKNGYRVAVISQPDFTDEDSIAVCGVPKYAFLVSAGNMDSMVNHYTVNKKPRSSDAYSPGGKAGKRPDRAVIVYTNLIRKKFGKIPVIIGGIEASLRRMSHYDYWQDKVRRSVLLDSGADLLSYGMGEKTIVEIAGRLAGGEDISELTDIRGTVCKTRSIDRIPDLIELPDYDSVFSDKRTFAESFRIRYRNTDPFTAVPLSEKYGENRYIVQNPPPFPLSSEEMDEVYELPYRNAWHPSYDAEGGVPALQEVKFSITSNRGCFGSCSFCALHFHQGRIVQARSQESILREAVRMTKDPDFKGYIHDVGGPTADFRGPSCQKQLREGTCTEKQCLFPKPCRNLITGHKDYTELLKKLRSLPGVKKVFIRSGIRFDYVLCDPDDSFMEELCRFHVSGQLRTAPEHVSERVLRLMGKPEPSVYRKFCEKFERVNRTVGETRQYAVPYLISSHPGSELSDAVKLAEAVRDMGYMPEQVQDFYPTPYTASTCMYYSGYDPLTMEKVTVVRNSHEKQLQRALIQYRKPENYALVKEALLKAGREDLIGNSRDCLIPYRPPKNTDSRGNGPKNKSSAGAPQKNGNKKTAVSDAAAGKKRSTGKIRSQKASKPR